MPDAYKLCSTLLGHAGDVRSVCASNKGYVVSGSRDLTAKLWLPNDRGTGYIQTYTLTGHDNFVSSVCFLPPSDTHPEGLICTGSNDHKVRVFCLKTSPTTPITIITQHSNNVCKVRCSVDGKYVLTSSWDKTGGMFNPGTGERLAEFSGHTAAVWSIVQLHCGLICTASADRTIRTYNKAGAHLKVLTGHTDCVRDLALASDGYDDALLSCANDATIRKWNAIAGTCLNTYHQHQHYIYSIDTMPGLGWVSASEDHTVKVWSGGEVVATLSLPVASVWSVAVLPNNDIVTGSSDGVVRIFTANPSRYADSETLLRYVEQVENFGASTSNNGVGDIKLSELPGKEGLLDPGLKDGQTKIIREDSVAVAYSWLAAECRWEKIGEVTGTANNKTAVGIEGSKVLYNGKEYDFVFNVDIEDGAPPLKLPYNKNVDPWLAAQQFIHDNNLPQVYLEQVANFIITNSDQFDSTFTNQTEFVDPLTGAGRYVPSTDAKENSSATNNNKGKTSQQQQTLESEYFPQREFIKFEQANVAAIRDKIITLNNDNNLGADKNGIEALMHKCETNAECSVKDLILLDRLLDWPKDLIFPVLDITRIVIKKDPANGYLCNEGLLQRLWDLKDVSPNDMLSLRILSNMLGSDIGFDLASKNRLQILEFIKIVGEPCSKPLQVSAATLLLNIAVLITRGETTEGRQEVLQTWMHLFPKLNDPEAVFRALVSLGTLLYYNTSTNTNDSTTSTIMSLVQTQVGSPINKVSQCAHQLLQLIL